VVVLVSHSTSVGLLFIPVPEPKSVKNLTPLEGRATTSAEAGRDRQAASYLQPCSVGLGDVGDDGQAETEPAALVVRSLAPRSERLEQSGALTCLYGGPALVTVSVASMVATASTART
jgi:hypothetical protein